MTTEEKYINELRLGDIEHIHSEVFRMLRNEENFKNYHIYASILKVIEDKKKTLTIEGAMKHPLYEHKTLQDEGIKIGEAIYKTITNKIGCVCIDN